MVPEQYIGGWHVVLAALEDPVRPPEEILLSADRDDERARRVRELAAGRQVPLRIVARGDLDLWAPGLRHQGVLARIAERAARGEDLLDAMPGARGLILALDGVQDPHNLGACLRTAEAAGAQAVIVPKDRAAGLTPVARKASAGASERIPFLAVTNLARTLERLKELGWWLTGLAGEAEQSLFDADFGGPVVLVLGAEGEGLRRLTRERCDRLVRIPMLGAAESLNVSVAAAVCLYEVMRQRGATARRRQS